MSDHEPLECTAEECSAVISASIAEESGGLCESCLTGTDEPASKPRRFTFGNLGWFALILCALAIAISIFWSSLFSDVYDWLTLSGKLRRHGIETEAVLWEVQVDHKLRGKVTNRRHVYTRTYKARFIAQDDRLCEVDMEDGSGSHPFMKFLATRQPFLIRYLPDDPFRFAFVINHDEKEMEQTIKTIQDQPLFKKALIRADPVVLSSDGLRGYAVIHVSHEMLGHPWFDHPLALAGKRRRQIASQGKSSAFVGLSSATTMGGITGTNNLHPEDSGAPDAFGILNLVKPGDEVEIKLQSTAESKTGGRYTLTAVFTLELPRQGPIDLGPADVKAVKVEPRR